jgi:hypothetical protein
LINADSVDPQASFAILESQSSKGRFTTICDWNDAAKADWFGAEQHITVEISPGIRQCLLDWTIR